MDDQKYELSMGLNVLPFAAGIALAAVMAVPQGAAALATTAFVGTGVAVAATVGMRRMRREPKAPGPPPVAGADASVALPEILHQALKATGARRAALLTKDETGSMQVAAQVAEASASDPISADDALARRAVRTARCCLAHQDSGSASGVSAPLRCPEVPGYADIDVLGAVVVREKPEGRFTESDAAAVESLASQASMHLVSKSLYGLLYDSFRGTIRSLAAAMEARDPYTRGHGQRLSCLARAIAERLDLDRKTIEMLGEAAALHDIGKIGLPDTILRKQGPLAPDEWEAVRAYPIASEQICRPLRLRPEVLFLIRHHAERLDGSGYPDGLRADDQPLPLRVLAVADAFDAMSSERPYRRALDIAERLAELDKQAGVKFDTQVVDALRALVSEGSLAEIYPPTDPGAG